MPQSTTSLALTGTNNFNRIQGFLEKYPFHIAISVPLQIAIGQLNQMMALLEPHCKHINLGNNTNGTDVIICDDLSRITGSTMKDVQLGTGTAIVSTTFILAHKSYQAKKFAGIETLSAMVSAGSILPALEFLSGLGVIEFDPSITIPGTGTSRANTITFASMILLGIVLGYTLEYPLLPTAWERKKHELKIESDETTATKKSQRKTHQILNSLFALDTSSAFSFLIWNLLAEMRFWGLEGEETIESVLSWLGSFSTIIAGIVFTNLGNKTIQICGYDMQLNTEYYANILFKCSRATALSNIIYGGISNLLFVIDPSSTFEENPLRIIFYTALCLSGSAHAFYYFMERGNFNPRINEEINSAFEKTINGVLQCCKKTKSKKRITENKEIGLHLMYEHENKPEKTQPSTPKEILPTNSWLGSIANFFKSLCRERPGNIDNLETPLLSRTDYH